MPSAGVFSSSQVKKEGRGGADPLQPSVLKPGVCVHAHTQMHTQKPRHGHTRTNVETQRHAEMEHVHVGTRTHIRVHTQPVRDRVPMQHPSMLQAVSATQFTEGDLGGRIFSIESTFVLLRAWDVEDGRMQWAGDGSSEPRLLKQVP